MATISPTDLRTKRGASSFNLSIFPPATLLTASVNNGSIARGARTIAYDGGSGTGYATIEAFQLLEVDTQDGTTKYVRIRAKSGNQTSGTLTVDENAINWTDNDTIRVKHFYPLVPVPPSIRSQVFYKFYDIPYNDNQNSTPNPVAIIGSHLVGRLSAGSVAFSLNSSSSYAIAQGATISSRVWSCVHNGGATTGISFSNTTVANPTLTITETGQYWLKCTVTDSNGKQQGTWRAIFVYDSTTLPYQDFTVQSLSGDWQRGGWSFNVQATGDVTLADFPDLTLAVLWYDNTFNGVAGYVDLWGTATQQIVCAGYLRKDQDNDRLGTGTYNTSFEVTTPDSVMDNMSELGSISLNAVTSPNKWYRYASWMTVGRAVHHLLKWHSTVLETCDVLGLADNTLGVKNADFTEPSLLQMINNLAYQRGIFAKLVSARTGRLYLVEDSQLLNTAARAALDTVFSIATTDISDMIDLVRSPEERIATATLDGFSFNGTASTPLISISPGYRESSVSYGMPEFRGISSLQIKGQVLDDQTDSNEKCGRVLAQANNNPFELRFTTPYNGIGAFDIVPSIGWYQWSISDSVLARDTGLNGKNLLCRNITHNINHEQGTVSTSLVFEIEALGADGIQGNYPTSYPAPTLRVPDWTPPENNAPILLTYADGDDSNKGKAVVATVSAGVITAGAIATFETGATSYTSVCTLSATKALVCYRDAGNSNQGTACILDVSGTTITPGTPVVFETGNTTYIDVCALSATQAIVTYRDNDNTNKGTACVLDVSGSTITPATPAVFETGATLFCAVTRISATKAIVCYQDADNSSFGTACVLDVAASVITANAPAVFYADATGPVSVDTLDSGSVIATFALGTGGTAVYGIVIYNITTTFSVGSAVVASSIYDGFDSSEPGNKWVRAVSSTQAVLTWQCANIGSAPDNFKIFGNAMTIAGTTVITPGAPVRLSNNSYDEVATVAIVNATNALIFYGQQAVNASALTVTLAAETVTSDSNTAEVTANYARYTSSTALQ